MPNNDNILAFKIWDIPSNYVIMFVGSVLMNRFEIYSKEFENIIVMNPVLKSVLRFFGWKYI